MCTSVGPSSLIKNVNLPKAPGGRIGVDRSLNFKIPFCMSIKGNSTSVASLLFKINRPFEVASRVFSFVISFSKALALHEVSLFILYAIWSRLTLAIDAIKGYERYNCQALYILTLLQIGVPANHLMKMGEEDNVWTSGESQPVNNFEWESSSAICVTYSSSITCTIVERVQMTPRLMIHMQGGLFTNHSLFPPFKYLK
ncbi:trafficking protein particle complex II-specific subunit 130 [Artemisia annua]|uniref:Trafficking protein particle complex II-specific subunit 130 n=1 Tax=Artemisia annua TaxID=35608 RepID=A0A2U1KST4_ARTAN|nr:trafficking protein particle complex II-specific subunit 130 [Artemisia annua]